MAKAELTLLAQAENDLIELRRYSLREFGRAAADSYVEDIRSVFQLLRANPLAGAPRPDLAKGVRSFSKRKHLIVYIMVGNMVQIVRILHHSRDVPQNLRP